MTHLQLHLHELKYTFFIILINFLYTFTIAYYFSDQLIYLFVNNLLNKNMLKYFIFTNITEIFVTNISISIFITFFITIQIILLLIWFFLKKGLYKFENYICIKFYILYLFLNLLIIHLSLNVIIPYIWCFLLNLNFSNLYILRIYFEPKINNYFDFIFSSFIYIFLISIYLFLFFLTILNDFFQSKIILNLRKFIYLKILFLSAFITPPEIFYFLFIFCVFSIIFEMILYFYIYLKKYKLKNNSKKI